MKKVIFYQAKPVGVHDMLNYYWDGVQFNEGVPTPIEADEFDEELRAASHYLDIRYQIGKFFFGSERLIVAEYSQTIPQ